MTEKTVKTFGLFLLLLFAAPASADTRAFCRVYIEPWSTLSGVPRHEKPMLGEFGVQHEGSGRLRLIGSVETKMVRHERGWRMLGSVFYHIGGKLDVTRSLTLEAAHGSWHHIDRPGDIEIYNRFGIEVKL